MGQLTVKEVEQKTTTTGKELKKVVMSEEGREWDYKGVTVWSDHPQYASVVVGATLSDCHINVKPSDVPNPHKEGTFYNNYTLYKGDKPQATTQSSGATDDKLTAIYGLLKDLCKHQGMESITEAPTSDEDINPQDIPF